MKTASVLAASLALLAGSPASASPPLKLKAFAEKARVTGSATSDRLLDAAASYWLARGRGTAQSVPGEGQVLAAAIRLARSEALRSGTKPLPEQLQADFRPHYTEKVLDKARWTVAAPGSRLGRLLARWPVKSGAVTLGEVIVFKIAGATKNRRLIAHELAHVEQYHRLGIDKFARGYARDLRSFEDAADAKSREVVSS